MPEIMTTKEVAAYLKLHDVTVCKHADEGAIPAKRIGRVWRFDKEIIDRWIAGGQTDPGTDKSTGIKKKKKPTRKTKQKKRKG